MSGRFIVFEGGEACGKSTQSQLLARRIDALLTHEPGGTRIGMAVRELFLDKGNAELDAKAEALLIAADKAQHVAQIIRPALERGDDVVCDRYVASSLVYQGFGRGIDMVELRSLLTFATSGLEPDLTVLLEAPLEIVESRLGANRDRIESESQAFHERVRAGYRELAAADPERWVVIDGAGTVADVSKRVFDAVNERLPRS
jgi:dTMP kinase